MIPSKPDNVVLISVFNSLEKRFCPPICFGGPGAVEMGRRAFEGALRAIPEGSPTRASDLSLWGLGEYDSITGRILCYESPIDFTLIDKEGN